MVGYLRRFYVTFIKTKELLTQNVIGEPLSFQVNAFSSDFYGIHDNSRNSIARGGVLRDLGSYAVDIILWLFGDIQVESAEINSIVGPDSEDIVTFAVQKQSPLLKGKCSVSWCMQGYRMPEVILSIRGSRGSIEANDDTVSLNLDNGSASTWSRHNLNDDVSFWLGGPEYYREDSHFLKAVEEGSPAEPSFATASRVDSVMDEIRRKADKK